MSDHNDRRSGDEPELGVGHCKCAAIEIKVTGAIMSLAALSYQILAEMREHRTPNTEPNNCRFYGDRTGYHL